MTRTEAGAAQPGLDAWSAAPLMSSPDPGAGQEDEAGDALRAADRFDREVQLLLCPKNPGGGTAQTGFPARAQSAAAKGLRAAGK